MRTTNIRFTKKRGLLSSLEIHRPPGRRLLPELTDVLFNLRVQVVRSDLVLGGPSHRETLYLVEFDGGPIDQHRQLEIQTAVISAVERLILRHGVERSGHLRASKSPLYAA